MRSSQPHQLSDAQFVRGAQVGTGSNDAYRRGAFMGSKRTDADGLHPRLREKELRPDYRDLLRSGAWNVLGRRQQPRRGLRDCVVTFKLASGERIRLLKPRNTRTTRNQNGLKSMTDLPNG